jgi:hypothetical protein
LLFPFFSPKVHTADHQQDVHEAARAEIRERKGQA